MDITVYSTSINAVILLEYSYFASFFDVYSCTVKHNLYVIALKPLLKVTSAVSLKAYKKKNHSLRHICRLSET